MIRKIIQLYWYEKTDKTQEHRTFRKSFARLKKHGFSGMQERLDKDYNQLKKDIIAHSKVTKKYSTFITRFFFSFIFILLALYFLVIKSELYESQTALMVRDLSPSIPDASLGLALLGAGSGSQLQDSMVVEEYILSPEIFFKLDEKFHLVQHYKSDALDLIERLPSDATAEKELKFYRKRVHVEYDETSGILHISYAHTNPQTAQQILKYMITQVENQLNEFNREKSKKQLKFIEAEYEKNKKKLQESIAKIEEYQNKHLLLDPSTQATSSSEMIASLEATLTQKKIELATKESYFNENNYEVQALKNEIKEIEQTIESKKKTLSGNGESRLNKVLFEYEQLKLELDFNTEIYKNALVQLESIKLDVLKEAKTLSIVSKPNLPDGYTYPNKPKVFITIVIVMLLLYGIFSMLSAIIRDHKE